jgi:hypothetical protein
MMQIEAPSFFSSRDQDGSRSTPTNCSSSFLCNCGLPTTKGARPRTRDAQGARSPAAREYGGGGAVVESGERCGRRRGRERERERERERDAVKSKTEWVTAR